MELYQKKYLKYKEKYLKLKHQIGGNNFRCQVLDLLPFGQASTSERFMVDIRVYDKRPIPLELEIKHSDKTLNYVAFVHFNNEFPLHRIKWNLIFKHDKDQKILNRNADIFDKYEDDNRDEIIRTAIAEFKKTYPSFQPEKTWM